MSIIYKKNHLAFLLAIAMFLLVIFGPKLALSSEITISTNGLDQSPVTRGLCNVFEMANGNIGKAIAIFAIVAVGFGFFTGKFSIALVIGITLGIGILFGAPKIISALTGNQAVDCSTITSGDAVECPQTIQLASTGTIPAPTGGIALSSYPTSLTTSPSIPSKTSYTISGGGAELVNFTCSLLGTTPTWKITNNIITASIIELPFTIGGFAITSSVSPFISNTLAAGASSLQFLPNKFCPPLTAQLEIISTTCTAGFVQIGVDSTSGTPLKVCVNAGSTTDPAVNVLRAITTATVTNSAALSKDAGATIVISRPGFVHSTEANSTALTATLGNVAYKALCTAGSAGKSGYWKISLTSGTTSGQSIASSTSITFQ